MGKKLYIGNLPYQMTDSELQDLFSEAGSVASATVVMDRQTGQSRGFGFVEMATDEEAKAAREKFNGTDVRGRALRVDEANERERPSGPRGGGGGGGGGGGYRSRGGY